MEKKSRIRYMEIGTSTTSPTENKKRKEVEIKIPKKENIIFIGSEMYYDSFWLKMMFISAAHVLTNIPEKFRPADKNTIAYVDNGYTHAEKLTLDYLREKKGYEIIKLTSSADIVSCFSKDRNEYKLQDVAFFSHGVIGEISLNYWSAKEIILNKDLLPQIPKNSFSPNGRIYSYACRTGISEDDWGRGFENVEDARPESSLAQVMSNYFGIEVHAFLKRSFYGDVLREKAQSITISSILKKEREKKDGQLSKIPPDHEALPHEGLAASWNPFSGPKREGTDNYALWRKKGGLKLPVSADTPSGLPSGMRVFHPKI